MIQATTAVASVLAPLQQLVEAVAATCRQERTAVRFRRLSYGLPLSLGRHTITQLLQGLDEGERDWSAAYALFRQERIDLAPGRRALLAAVLAAHGPDVPLPVVVDATHLPRTSKALVGVGWGRCPHNPAWAPGLQRLQRWEGLSALLPVSDRGESRAVPLSFDPAPTPQAVPWPGHPPCTEGEAALAALAQLTGDVAALGRPEQAVLAIADGNYSGAPFLKALPANVTLLVRCAKNRALYALPDDEPTGGRPRIYGPKAPRPDADLTGRAGWQRLTLTVRDRTIPVRSRLRGPYRIKGAPGRPVFLLVVGGVGKRPGHKRRDPSFWLVTAVQAAQGAWVLPAPVADLLAWTWQRWEVEVMHRELKSGFGLGEQQAWSPVAARVVIQWVVWVYACLVVAGYLTWGWGRGPRGPKWWRGRRWTARSVVRVVRAALWGAPAFGPVGPGFPANPGERAPPAAAMTPCAVLARRI